MEFISVVVAALGSFAFGAVYYMTLEKPWLEVAGVPLGEDGKPTNSSSPVPYMISFICMIIVAGMMRHVFALSGIEGAMKGLVSGFGIGLFFISPWIVINTAYSIRPMKLALIDSGYAAAGCAIMGLILTLF